MSDGLSRWTDCPRCGGDGEVRVHTAAVRAAVPCRLCGGSGKVAAGAMGGNT